LSVEIGYVDLVFDWMPLLNTLNILIVLTFTTVMVYIIAREMSR